MFATNADSEADEQETPVTREEIIAEHDRLVEEYNRTDQPELLEQIAVLEMALLASEPT